MVSPQGICFCGSSSWGPWVSGIGWDSSAQHLPPILVSLPSCKNCYLYPCIHRFSAVGKTVAHFVYPQGDARRHKAFPQTTEWTIPSFSKAAASTGFPTLVSAMWVWALIWVAEPRPHRKISNSEFPTWSAPAAPNYGLGLKRLSIIQVMLLGNIHIT